MSKITEEELVEKYGHVPLQFSFYYKFNFCFKGECVIDGEHHVIKAWLGGNSDNIYKREVSAWKAIYLVEGVFNSIVVHEDGKIIYGWSDML